MKNILLKSILLLSFLFTAVTGFAQGKIPPKPSLETSYYEIGTTLLNQEQKQAIERKLIQYADSTSTQIVVVVVPTTDGEDPWKYAFDIADTWKIGQAGKDNGILLLVAKDDRKIAIQTGRGVEHLMTDAMSKLIIDNDITPAFKEGDYYAGIDKGTTAIIQVMNGEYKEERKNLRKGDNDGGGGGIFFFVIVFIIIIIILSKRGGGGGNNRGGFGSTLTDILILSSLGRGGGSRGGFGGFGGGSGGGGGFGGGFGGGGFGGGGASGGW